MLDRSAALALLYAKLILAQPTICDGPSIVIASSSDAAQIADCQVYQGDVIIDSSASGLIVLNGVHEIKGDLTCNNATQLTAITSDKLNTITGTFGLSGLVIMSTLEFGALTDVNQINWVGLPGLQSLNFAQGVSNVNRLYISDTQLNNLNGLELTTVGEMDVNNNPYLTDVNLNDLRNVTAYLSFSNNENNLALSLPNLETAANITVRNMSKVDIPSLTTITGSLGLYSNLFESLAAPALTKIAGSLLVVDCLNLTSLSFPGLSYIGDGLTILNNTNLDSIDGFPKLQTVIERLDLVGEFNSVSFPSLADVGSGSVVQTSSTNGTICEVFDSAHAAGIIKGTNTCSTGANPAVTAAGSSPTIGGATSSQTGSASSRSAPGSGLSAGAIGGIVGGAVGGLIVVVSGLIWWYCLKRHHKSRQNLEINRAELPLGGHFETPELLGSSSPSYQTPGAESSSSHPHQPTRGTPPKDNVQEMSELENDGESEHAFMGSRIEGHAALGWNYYYTPELEGSNVPELETRPYSGNQPP